MIKFLHLNRIFNQSRSLIPNMESINQGVTDWIVAKSNTLFQDNELPVVESFGYGNAEVLLQSGESMEWSLDQDHKDIIQTGLKEGVKTMTPGFIRGGLSRIRKFIWISFETDEVLDEDMNACPVSENMTAPESMEVKKSLFRRAVSAINPGSRVFFGFVKVWKKLVYGFGGLVKKAFTFKRTPAVKDKVEFKLVNTYIPNTSIPIKTPGQDKILQVRVLYNRI